MQSNVLSARKTLTMTLCMLEHPGAMPRLGLGHYSWGCRIFGTELGVWLYDDCCTTVKDDIAVVCLQWQDGNNSAVDGRLEICSIKRYRMFACVDSATNGNHTISA
jgi:hypothetical protein